MPTFQELTTAELSRLAEQQRATEARMAAADNQLGDIAEKLIQPTGTRLLTNGNELNAILGAMHGPTLDRVKKNGAQLQRLIGRLQKPTLSRIAEGDTLLTGIAARLDRGQFPSAGPLGQSISPSGNTSGMGTAQPNQPGAPTPALFSPTPVGNPSPSSANPDPTTDGSIPISGVLGASGSPAQAPTPTPAAKQPAPTSPVVPITPSVNGKPPPPQQPAPASMPAPIPPSVPAIPPAPAIGCDPCESAAHAAQVQANALHYVGLCIVYLADRYASVNAGASALKPPPLVWSDPPDYEYEIPELAEEQEREQSAVDTLQGESNEAATVRRVIARDVANMFRVNP